MEGEVDDVLHLFLIQLLVSCYTTRDTAWRRKEYKTKRHFSVSCFCCGQRDLCMCRSVRPSVHPSVGLSHFSFFFSFLSILKVCIWACPCPNHYCPCLNHNCPCPTHYCPCPRQELSCVWPCFYVAGNATNIVLFLIYAHPLIVAPFSVFAVDLKISFVFLIEILQKLSIYKF